MPHIRAICQATVDHPHADGIVNDGGFGSGGRRNNHCNEGDKGRTIRSGLGRAVGKVRAQAFTYLSLLRGG